MTFRILPPFLLAALLAACESPSTAGTSAGATSGSESAGGGGGGGGGGAGGSAQTGGGSSGSVGPGSGGGTGGGRDCNPAPGDHCAEYYGCEPPSSPGFTAFGFERTEVAFQTIWAVEPGQPGAIRALPGHYLSPSAFRYMSIPFVMTADSGSASQFTFSAIEAAGLEGVVTGSVSASISPCPGDFRPREPGSADVYLSHQCRNSQTSSVQFNLTVTSVEGQSGCLSPPGKVMYLNLATHHMYATEAPQMSTCGNATTCGVSMRLL